MADVVEQFGLLPGYAAGIAPEPIESALYIVALAGIPLAALAVAYLLRGRPAHFLGWLLLLLLPGHIGKPNSE